MAEMLGRPSKCTDAVVESICARLANGESLVAICSDEGMPARQTVLRWLSEDSHSDFRDKYARAREAQADWYAEDIINISDELTIEAKYAGEDVSLDVSSSAVARNRLRVDARKWYASKLAPKKYGDKLELGGDASNPLHVITKIERVIVDSATK